MSQVNIDKTLVARRFSKAAGTYSHEATVQQQIAGKMIGLLRQSLSPSQCRKIVEFGCGTGFYSRLLQRTFQPEYLWLNDICHNMQTYCSDILDQKADFLAGDAERVPFPERTELITSCSTLQWFEAPGVFFGKCHQALCDNGYLAFTTFGKENLYEIDRLTGNGLTYRSRKELEKLLQPDFHILHSEEEVMILPFETPMQVLYHLKQTGVTGITRHQWSRSNLQHFCEQYTRRFGNGKHVPLTYHPIYIIAQKKL